MKFWTFEGTFSIWKNSELSWLVGALIWFFFRVLDMTRCHKFPYADESLGLQGWFGCNEILLPNSKDPKLGYRSIRRPASKEIISASVQLWETEVRFWHLQLIGTNAWLPKMQKDSAWCWFWIFCHRQNQNFVKKKTIFIVVLCFPWQYGLNVDARNQTC